MPETESGRSEESNRKFFFADCPGKPIFERIRLCKGLGSENPGKGSRIPERLRKNSGEFPENTGKNRKNREIAKNAGREFPEERSGAAKGRFGRRSINYVSSLYTRMG